ncbi:DUF5979 domain-containing protein, partial [Demequina sp. NBRC 110053]|uniref:DUF5979 domain-containing protein n=1 Tax=Demequina sp. NBRC 110053 TaxID=1570342 RepID=UPI00190EE883
MNAVARTVRGTANLAIAVACRIVALVAVVAIAILAFGLAAIPASAAEVAPAADTTVSTPAVSPTPEPTPSAEPRPAAELAPATEPVPAAEPAQQPSAPPAPDEPDVAPAPAPAAGFFDALSRVRASVSTVADGHQLTVAADWAEPAGTPAGSHFGLSLPPELIATPVAPFPLLDAAGVPVGECEVTHSAIDCTVNDYGATHQNVHGDLWFKVTAHYTDGADHVNLVGAGGATYRIPLTVDEPTPSQPHTQTSHAYHPAAHPTKRARRVDSTRRRIDWEVTVPTSARPSHSALTITDTWSGGNELTYLGDAKLSCKAQTSGHTSGVGAHGFSVTARPDGITVGISDSQCDGTYVLTYGTELPASAHSRTTFENIAAVPGQPRATAHATWNPPAQLSKSVKGDNEHRRAEWTVVADAPGLGTGEAVIKDRYSDRLTLDPESVSLSCRVLGRTHGLDSASWSTSGSDASNQLLEVSISDQTCRVDGGQYVLSYTTAYPLDAFTGEAYSNTVEAGSVTTTKEVTYTASAGGAASGVALWALHLTKDVTGPGEAAVGDTPFDVAWSYGAGADAKSGVLHVHDGSSATLARIPEGAAVTLTEARATVDGVTFTAPVYSGRGVTASGERAATVSGSSGTVEVQLENPTTAVPPLAPVAAPHQVPHQVPPQVPTAVPPLVPS